MMRQKTGIKDSETERTGCDEELRNTEKRWEEMEDQRVENFHVMGGRRESADVMEEKPGMTIR